jgi:hypothetical protein
MAKKKVPDTTVAHDPRNAQQPAEQLTQSLIADVEAAPAPSDEDLKKIAESARAIYKLELEIAAIEKLLAAKAAQLKMLSEVTVPAAMDGVGMTGFQLGKGFSVEIKEILAASIPKDGKDAAFALLERDGAGGLIKRKVVVLFGKGEDAWAKKFIRDMAQRKKPLNATIDMAVHAQSLGAYVREKKAVGMLSDEMRKLLGVFELRKAFVKGPAAPTTLADEEVTL